MTNYKAEKIIENDFSNLDEVFVVNMADFHIGALNVDYELLKDTVDFIATKNNIFITLGGDLIDNGTKNSVGNIFEQTMTPKDQALYVIELLKPVKERIIGSVAGNHELRRDSINANIDWSEYIAEALGIKDKYNPYSIINYISVGKNEKKKGRSFYYSIHTRHGSAGGATLATVAKNSIKGHDMVSGIDVFQTAHTHHPLIVKEHERVFYSQSKTVRDIDYYAITTGSFLSYGNYAAQKGLKSKSMGAIGVLLSGKDSKNITPLDFESIKRFI